MFGCLESSFESLLPYSRCRGSQVISDNLGSTIMRKLESTCNRFVCDYQKRLNLFLLRNSLNEKSGKLLLLQHFHWRFVIVTHFMSFLLLYYCSFPNVVPIPYGFCEDEMIYIYKAIFFLLFIFKCKTPTPLCKSESSFGFRFLIR